MPDIILKPKRERSLLRKHPWVFSGAVARVKGDPQPGETVDVASSQGMWLGRGAYSPVSQIRVRLWTFEKREEISALFFHTALQKAIQLRSTLPMQTRGGSCRWVNAESDGLPGIIVDGYGDFLVCQFLTTGAEFWKSTIVRQLEELLPHAGIFERSDTDARDKEGLPKTIGVLSGKTPPDLVEILEGSCRFLVDIKNGHKTGFYLDQRENRTTVSEYAKGGRVLNCFAYTGAFAVAALKAGANHVTNMDSSAEALELARKNMALNDLDPEKVKHVAGDVFQVLRQYRDSGTQFDMVILDPPKFAESISQLKQAGRGYKDINLLAMKLLRPGGYLCTFSCSGVVTRDLFQKMVADAALDAGRDLQIIRWLSQAQDHPVGIHFPEGLYLKGLIGRVW